MVLRGTGKVCAAMAVGLAMAFSPSAVSAGASAYDVNIFLLSLIHI